MMLLPLLLSLISDGSRAQGWLYRVQVPGHVKVQEGLCVFLPCSIEYPKDGWTDTTPAYGYWFTKHTDMLKGAPVATNHPDREVQESARGRFLLVGDPSKNNCSLLLREARMEDMGLYVFRLERGDKVKYNFKQWPWLEVTALTQKPDIFIPEELEPGRPVKALCVFNLTSELCPAPTFSWMGAAVTTQRTQLRSTHYSVLSFSPRLQDQDTELTCRVDFPLSARSTHESVRLSVRLRLVGKGGCLAQVVLVAIGEAMAKILLLLGLCLILRLRSHSKDETREARGTQDTSQVER